MKILEIAESWFTKGANEQYRSNLTGAIDCYKQALVAHFDHYPSAFNLATCYELEKMFSCSIRWFNHAYKIKPDLDEACMGACFASIKIG